MISSYAINEIITSYASSASPYRNLRRDVPNRPTRLKNASSPPPPLLYLSASSSIDKHVSHRVKDCQRFNDVRKVAIYRMNNG